MIERSNDAEKSERPYWFEDTPTLDPALSAQMPEHVPAPAQSVGMRAVTIEECARVAENYPSSGSATEHPVEYWIRALASQPSPAATVTDGSIQEGDVLSYTMTDGVGKVTAHVRPHNGSSAASEAEIHDIIAAAIGRDGLTHSGVRSAARDVIKRLTAEPQAVPMRAVWSKAVHGLRPCDEEANRFDVFCRICGDGPCTKASALPRPQSRSGE